MAENEIQNTNVENEEKKKHNKFVAWWMGLKNPVKIAICAATGVGVASAVIFPILGNTVWANKPVIEGVQVTEAQWKAALSNATTLTNKSNFTMFIKGDESSNGSSGDSYYYVNGLNVKSTEKQSDNTFNVKFTLNYGTKMFFVTETKGENEGNNFEIYTMSSTDGIRKSIDDYIDEINKYDDYNYNTTSHFYECHKAATNSNGGESAHTLRFKFDSNYNLIEIQKQKDGKTEIDDYKFSDYNKTKFDNPIITNFLKFENDGTTAKTQNFTFTQNSSVFFQYDLSNTSLSLDKTINIRITNNTEDSDYIQSCTYMKDQNYIDIQKTLDTNVIKIEKNVLQSNQIIYFALSTNTSGLFHGKVINK